MKFVALIALLGGCVDSSSEGARSGSHEDPRDDVLGSPDDVHTKAGEYAGYRVARQCTPATESFIDLGVAGTGSVALTQDATTAAGYEILGLLGDLQLSGGGGYGYACEAGFGTTLMLRDWRDVDSAIARVGTWMAERDLALQVAITLGVPRAI